MTKRTSPEVIFGISGSISAYKSLDVIRLLRKSQFNITPILSESADRFVTPWSVECLAESSIVNDEVRKGNISHIDICKTAQAFIICPASANIISKLAHGTASDILTSSFLSYTGPKVIFPLLGLSILANIFKRVDLPAPFSPTSPIF